MFSNSEKLNSAAKAQCAIQMDATAALARHAIEGWLQGIGLSMEAAKAQIAGFEDAARQAIHATSVQDFWQQSQAQVKPGVDRALAYGREMSRLASKAHADFIRQSEAAVLAAGRTASHLLDCASERVPAGGNTVALVKSVLGQGSAGYEQLARAAQQASGVMEVQVDAAANQMNEAFERAVTKPQSNKSPKA